MNTDKRKIWILRIAALAASVLLAALPAMAEESAAESPMGDLFHWINFAVVFIAIAYLLVKVGAPAFRARAEKIQAQIGEAAKAREAAEAQRREVQQKMVNLAKDVADMRAAAKRDAEAEAARLREMAKAEAEKIEKIAQAEIAAAERAARLELKAVGARLAVERAEAMLKKDMTPQGEAQLFQAFVAELERSAN